MKKIWLEIDPSRMCALSGDVVYVLPINHSGDYEQWALACTQNFDTIG